MSNLLEQQLDYPFADALPQTGETLPVAPGIQWLRMPLPFALDHINLWLLDDRGLPTSENPGQQGLAIIDCGISNAPTQAAWQTILARQSAPLLRVLATHCHPDHVGSANWLCSE